MPDIDADPLKSVTDRFVLLSSHMREAYRLWELWSLAARDKPLLERLGKSLTTQGFLDVRNSLHRSLVLALARMWDNNKRFNSLSIRRLTTEISSEPVKSILTARRTEARDYTAQLKLADPDISDEALAVIAADIADEMPGMVAEFEREIEALTAALDDAADSVSSNHIRTLRNKLHDYGFGNKGEPELDGDSEADA